MFLPKYSPDSTPSSRSSPVQNSAAKGRVANLPSDLRGLRRNPRPIPARRMRRIPQERRIRVDPKQDALAVSAGAPCVSVSPPLSFWASFRPSPRTVGERQNRPWLGQVGMLRRGGRASSPARSGHAKRSWRLLRPRLPRAHRSWSRCRARTATTGFSIARTWTTRGRPSSVSSSPWISKWPRPFIAGSASLTLATTTRLDQTPSCPKARYGRVYLS